MVSATHRDLEAAVAEGAFRQDLYHRLKVMTVKLPPLRERREDIPLLAAHFIKEFNAQHGKHVQTVAEPVRRAMMAYDWPGNVRELRNFIESMVVLDVDGVLGLDDVQDGEVAGQDAAAAGPVGGAVEPGGPAAERGGALLHGAGAGADGRQPRGGGARCWASASGRCTATSRSGSSRSESGRRWRRRTATRRRRRSELGMEEKELHRKAKKLGLADGEATGEEA